MQPHDHGREGHLAFHAVLADRVDDAGWEVDVEVAEENDAVRILEPTTSVRKKQGDFKRGFLGGQEDRDTGVNQRVTHC